MEVHAAVDALEAGQQLDRPYASDVPYTADFFKRSHDIINTESKYLGRLPPLPRFSSTMAAGAPCTLLSRQLSSKSAA